jgi:AcrR family transcriptional regulator
MPRISKEREAAVRARILDAGVRVFQEQGFRRAGMHDIASVAGLSSGAIYTYFASKEALFLAAFAALVADEEQALLAAISADRPTGERIRLAMDYFLEVAAARPQDDVRGAGPAFLLHAWANADESADLRARLLDRRGQMRSLARLIIADGIARGELPDGLDVEGLAGAVPSLLDGILLQRAELGDDFDVADARRQAYAVIDAILARG